MAIGVRADRFSPVAPKLHEPIVALRKATRAVAHPVAPDNEVVLGHHGGRGHGGLA